MDMVTLALAKAYSDKKGGYVESDKKTITFNGDVTGREQIPGEVLGSAGCFVKMLDSVIDPEKLESFTCYEKDANTGLIYKTKTFSKGEFVVNVDPSGAVMFAADGTEAILCFPFDISVDESTTITSGTYILTVDLDGRSSGVSSITYNAETVVPINPKYLPEGGVGYVESKKSTLTFDGDTTGKTVIQLSDEIFAVQISDVLFEPSELVSVKMTDMQGQVVSEYGKDLVITEQEVPHSWMAGANADGLPYLQVLYEDYVSDGRTVTKGVYVQCVSGSVFVSEVTYNAEITHQIKPEFIPGAVLPVVEIADIFAITTEESKKLSACIGMPCVIKIGALAGTFSYGYDDAYAFIDYSLGLSFVSEDGVTWVVS